MLGIFPLCLLLWSFYKVRWGTRDTLQLLVFLGLGFLAPLLPLAVYHLWYGVFGQWFYDWTVVPIRGSWFPSGYPSVWRLWETLRGGFLTRCS